MAASDSDLDRAGPAAIIALGLHILLNFIDRAVELLVFAAKFFRRIVVHHDVGIDAMAFNNPILSVLRVRRELRPEELTAIGQRKRVPNSDYAAPCPFADELAEARAI